MESLTWNKTDTDAVYAYMQEQERPAYIPVIVNFVIFFFNDMYGFISWRRREAVQG